MPTGFDQDDVRAIAKDLLWASLSGKRRARYLLMAEAGLLVIDRAIGDAEAREADGARLASQDAEGGPA